MPYAITKRCIQCNNCLPQCPTGAIQVVEGEYWIDSSLCNNCQAYLAPQCVVVCPVNSPVPCQAKKGRYKVDAKSVPNPGLFLNGKNHTFASAIIIWELCNVLAQGQSLPWEIEYILEARQRLGLSQRDLAQLTGKSQSWIRDIEKGRFQAKLEDQILLRKVLGMN